MACWKADMHSTTGPTPSVKSPLLNLPGELRNMIYDIVTTDVEQLLIRNGKIFEYPLARVNRQIRAEFGSIFSGAFPLKREKRFAPKKVVCQLQNFDFEGIVEVLDRCLITPSTEFDIQVRVTKQLQRDDWKRLWSWVAFCDDLMPKEHQGKALSTSYSTDLALRTCNPFAACHELYVETIPYILKSAGYPQGASPGYQEIAKMKFALRGAVAKGRSNDGKTSHE